MEKQNRKDWEREQRRNRIIDIAQDSFFEKGHENTTIEDIASAAGYNKRTIYLYFKDKEEIFLAVVLRGQKIFESNLRNSIQNLPDDASAIEQLGRAFFNFSIEHPEYFNLIMIYEAKTHVYYAEPNLDDSEFFKIECQKLSNDTGAIVVEAIERDKGLQKITSPLTGRQLMLLLWGQIFGVMQIILMRKDHFQESFEISYEEIFEYFLKSVKKSLA